MVFEMCSHGNRTYNSWWWRTNRKLITNTARLPWPAIWYGTLFHSYCNGTYTDELLLCCYLGVPTQVLYVYTYHMVTTEILQRSSDVTSVWVQVQNNWLIGTTADQCNLAVLISFIQNKVQVRQKCKPSCLFKKSWSHVCLCTWSTHVRFCKLNKKWINKLQ